MVLSVEGWIRIGIVCQSANVCLIPHAYDNPEPRMGVGDDEILGGDRTVPVTPTELRGR